MSKLGKLGMPGSAQTGGVLLLCGHGESARIIYHALARHFGPFPIVRERPRSRASLVRGRIRRLGFSAVFGQLLFQLGVQPLLKKLGRRRIDEICKEGGVIRDRVPLKWTRDVNSMNSLQVREMIGHLAPQVIVLSGTRILGKKLLSSIGCPVLNLHAGLTPRYRGVHGGFWALAEGNEQDVGSTLHLVDSGIDTGGVVGQVRFAVTERDNFATYPYLHVARGLALLDEAVQKVLAGEALQVTSGFLANESRLYYHPTIWRYFSARRHGVR